MLPVTPPVVLTNPLDPPVEPPVTDRTQQLQAQAAKARAAKAAKQAEAQAAAAAATPVPDLIGPANGEDTSEDADDLGLAPTSMSPAEAKEASLALLRDIFAVHPANVKALQKDLKVAKFSDVSVSDGHELYRKVVRIAHDVGMRV